MHQFGPYKIDGVLGRGGMGKVFSAVDQRTGERAAVKVLAPAYAGDPHFRARFGTEIQSLKKLRHAGIVELFGYGEQDGHLFYAMERVDGKSVAELLREGRRFAWREVVRIAIEICAALRHAHDRGVIHRDLKPANLMLTAADDAVKLTDFGIAKLFGSSQLTCDGGVLGTADFMSPEQADGKAATIRSDLYSLGSVMYAMLARRSPFAAPTMAEVIHRLMYDDPPPLERFAPETPRELSQLIFRLLEKDPEQRIGTALALANRLGEIDLAPQSNPTSVDGMDRDTRSPAPAPQLPRENDDGTDVPGAATSVRPTVAYRPQRAGGHSDVTKDAPTSGKTNEDDADPKREALVMPQAVDHFTSVSPGAGAAAERREDTRRVFRSNWPLLVLLGGAIGCLVVIVWLGTRPESADQVFARIELAEQSGRLSDAEADIRTFLTRFPSDSRSAEVNRMAQKLELQRWERQVELRRRLGGNSLPAAVQLLVEARQIAATDPAQATERFEALIALLEQMLESPPVDNAESEEDAAAGFSLEKDLRMCLAAAKGDLALARDALRQDMQRHLQWIDEQLDRADRLDEGQPDAASEIRRSIITLYADKPWAAEHVQRAEASLETQSSQ
jgi:serine/threonine-protein kinase